MIVHSVAEQLSHSMFNADPAVEPEGLRDLTPGTHQYLGDLPRNLCHLFVAVNQMNLMQFAFDQGNDQDVTEACLLFQKEVANFFNLPEETEFEILTGFKVALVKKQTTTEDTSVNSTSTPPTRFCDDMASY